MVKYAIATTILFLVASCTTQKQSNQETSHISIVGKKDKNGCLVGAGQSWSTLKKTCIQVFNEGIRLNPVNVKPNEAVYSAFVLYNDDRSKAELFLPNTEDNIILMTKDKILYSNGVYSYNPQKGILNVSGVKKYQTER